MILKQCSADGLINAAKLLHVSNGLSLSGVSVSVDGSVSSAGPWQQPWAAAVGFSALRGDLPVPPPLVSTLVRADVGQHCLIPSSHFVGVLLERGHRHASSSSLGASRHPLLQLRAA